jgi:pyruvate/2-oxoglutarate dehydrogenase complex dihydrolipoamide acyltransferase (E2) component
MEDDSFREFNYPPVRQFTADMGRLDRERHYVRALLEVDVTDALEKIKLLRSPGKKVSFLGWFIHVLAAAAQRHPPVSGIHRGRDRVVAFNQVDVSTVVEQVVDGVRVPLPLVLRSANRRTPVELSDEISAAASQKIQGGEDYVLNGGGAGWLALAARLPQWFRLWYTRTFILANPVRMQRMMGTVMVSSLGTSGRVTGWILPTSMHPLSIGIGSLNKKPAIHNGAIEKRTILHQTVAFDHNVVDGMPALQFVDDLVKCLEEGAALDLPA